MWHSLLLGALLGAGSATPSGQAAVEWRRSPGPEPVNVGQPINLQSQPLASTQPDSPAPIVVDAPLAPVAASKQAQTAAAVSPSLPDRWFLMKELQGNWLGAILDDNRTSISGWVEQSYTSSTNRISNQPLVWNDRANEYLLNSFWLRLDRSVVTTGTTEPTWGYRLDVSAGTDYRFSMMRGLFTSQLQNSRLNPEELSGRIQNLYGVDPIQFYTNVYIPTLFAGTDIRVGRLFCPWGYESLDGISTPFVSRSYAYNWSSPFTHMGVMVSPTFNAQWSGKFMLANGNDVFLDSPAQELRFVGAVTYTSFDKRDIVTLGTTIGRGKFNAGKPYDPATISEQFEPAGRNNLNVFDLVWTHTFHSRLSYAAELLYGYQYGVPANVPGGIISKNVTEGTAHWGSLAQYVNYQITPELQSITRFEVFDDFDGQRTGFEGVYTAVTTGFQYRPVKSLLIRPEIRFDYNGYSRPFENKHYLFSTAIDAIIRF